MTQAGAPVRDCRDRPRRGRNPPRRAQRQVVALDDSSLRSSRSWRDLYCGELRKDQIGSGSPSPAGSTRAAITAGSCSSTLRDHTGKLQLVVNPERAADAKGAHEIRNEFVVQARGRVVRRADAVNPTCRPVRWRCSRCSAHPLALTPLPFQLDEEHVARRCGPFRWLDMRRDRMQHNFRPLTP